MFLEYQYIEMKLKYRNVRIEVSIELKYGGEISNLNIESIYHKWKVAMFFKYRFDLSIIGTPLYVESVLTENSDPESLEYNVKSVYHSSKCDKAWFE